MTLAPIPAGAFPSPASDFVAALNGLAGSSKGSSFPSATREAADVVSNPITTSADLQELFDEYFIALERPLPTRLYDWLRIATLNQNRNAQSVREKLQAALAPVLAAKIHQIFAEHMPNLGFAVRDRPAVRETVVNTMHLLALIVDKGTGLSPASRQAIYDSLKAEIDAYPHILRRNVTIEIDRQPMLATIRAQLYQIMRDVKPLDARSFVEDTGFHGPYAEFVAERGMLVLDNNGLDTLQLQAIRNLLGSIPGSLHDTSRISVHALLGTPRSGDRWLMPIRGSRGVNIVAASGLARTQNQFPPDGNEVSIPVFCAVLQHELNHVVNAASIVDNPILSARQNALIFRADEDPLQHLRSHVEDRRGPGFFASYPQEFFASLANVYFADSLQTMELAQERFLKGYSEPLNQFLFFVEVYSRGGADSLFYTQDAQCHYEAVPVQLERDANGFISRIVAHGVPYEFSRDSSGNVAW
jgi:hypothetical protein